MRTSLFMLAGVAALLALPVMGRAQGTETQSSGKVQPHLRLQRVAIITASAAVGEGKKPFSPLLENAAVNTLRGRFSLPPFARITPEAVAAALAKRKESSKKPLAELLLADIPGALKEIGADAGSDRVAYVFIKEATSKRVTIQVWEVEAATGKVLTNGVLLHRSWDDEPVVTDTPGGGHSGTAKLPPLSAEAQSHMVVLMLNQWRPADYKFP